MEVYDFIIQTIREAGDLLMRERKQRFGVMAKDGDPRNLVTSVDKKVNEFLISAIKDAYPSHDIYSEEGGGVENTGSPLWTIDPIDGTANFSRAIPHFAVCIGVLENGIPTAGGVYNPVTRELFSFQKGIGAFLNDEPVHVSEVMELSKAHVFFHAGRKKEVRDWGGESYRRLLGNVRKTSNFASSSLDACFVASGRIEANIYGTLSTLDIAPTLGILIEAGGVVAGANGGPVTFSKDPQRVYMANNRAILDAVTSLLETDQNN